MFGIQLTFSSHLKAIVLIAAFLLSSVVWSEDQLIRVQTIGIGATEAEAVTDAQINALQLSYQTFISTDLVILNNQIVHDEIASLVSGTIQDFKVLSTFEDNLGLWEASIDATLTQGNLVRFAEAIGDEIKVQGSLFGTEIKQQNLNKANEPKVIQHLVKKAEFFVDFFDVSLSDENIKPKRLDNNSWQLYFQVNITANDNFEQLYQLVYDTLDAVSMSENEIGKYVEFGQYYYAFTLCKNPRYYNVRETNDERWLSQQYRWMYKGGNSNWYFSNSRSLVSDLENWIYSVSDLEMTFRPEQKCKQYFLRNLESINSLVSLDNMVEQDLQNYMVLSDPPVASVSLGAFTVNAYDSDVWRSSKKMAGLRISKQKVFLPQTRNQIYRYKDITLSITPDIRSLAFVTNSNAKKLNRHIFGSCEFIDNGTTLIRSAPFPCSNLLYRSGDTLEQYNSWGYQANPGVFFHYQNRLVFPSKGDPILDHTVSHSMSEDELASLLGYKIQKASETYRVAQEALEKERQVQEALEKEKEEKSWWEW
ncbi:MAG: hypothetical protein CMD78_01770 [Gammaproteobacteria bacterium]|nr:hypothetical protein [Gammaproteobacteria bacterium]|tara:strand:- start:343 stop:1947 length:1605 start_codon:yes stop_codon:yes gene_type:complete